MTDDELATHLAEHETRAIGYFESEIASEQAEGLKRYYRKPYGDERAGRSKVVDGIIPITIDNGLASVLKPFVSSDETVAFEPRSEEDVELAQQATEYVNYVLHHDNPGFLILHGWLFDGLTQKLGVVKAYWEDYNREKVVRRENLDALQIEEMAQDIEAVYGPDESGLYVADIRKVEQDGKLCIENIPPEEYRISPLARPGQVPPYEAHVTRKTRSALIEMGFDSEVVLSLTKSSNSGLDDSRAMERREDEEFVSSRVDAPGGLGQEMVDFNDEFALIDYDGDGISELRRVMRSGSTILYNEEVEYGLFARFTPNPEPHKIYGQSIPDQLEHESRISTAVTRQMLDNTYLHNNPRPIVGIAAERDDGTTLEDIQQDAPGAVIRARDATQVGSFVVPFVGDKSMAVLDYFSGQAEARTGISKHGQGMDPDAIDKAGQVTATQAAIMEDGRNARSEMIARVFAETGMKDLFKLMLKLLVEHQPRARMIRLRNKWVEMDPRSWNAEMDVSISVGLGTGNRAEQMAMAQAVLELDEKLGMSPFASLIDKEKVYNGVKKFLNAAGIKNVDDFVNEPPRDQEGNVIEEEPPPDPEMVKVQAEIEQKQVELQMKQVEGEQKIQLAREEMLMKMQLEREKAQAEMLMNEQRMAQELELERERLRMQHAVAMEQARQREEFSARDADRRDKEADSKIKKNRAGGQLDK
jgi:hypothetical protein